MPIRLFVLPDNSRKFFCPRFWSKNCSGKRAILHKSLVSLSYFFDACVRNVTSYCTSRLKLLQIKLVVFMETFQISSTTRIVHKFVFNNISGSLQTTELTWFRRKLFQICRCWSICKSLDHLFNFSIVFASQKVFCGLLTLYGDIFRQILSKHDYIDLLKKFLSDIVGTNFLTGPLSLLLSLTSYQC